MDEKNRSDEQNRPSERGEANTTNSQESGCCCSPSPGTETAVNHATPHWEVGVIATAGGEVPRVATNLVTTDRMGAWAARWGIRRMHHSVEPGLYAFGNPSPESPVFVSANYKLSFDRLRTALDGRDGWILVLDTKGINVWCAAGKGTFGTEEIVNRVASTRLGDIVSHRRLILPQLGAPGVSAHEVKRRTRFTVVYGPVRARDLPAFLDAGWKATPSMRRVFFPFGDRVGLIPVEVVGSAKYLLMVMGFLVVLSGLGRGFYSAANIIETGLKSAILLVAAYAGGTLLTPALLPWLPGRSFSSKGAWAGVAAILLVHGLMNGGTASHGNWLETISWFLIGPAIASFLGMNFTGASTYTSLSGVRREMRVAVPLQISGVLVGLGLWVGARFA